jgi:hypothetical protein
MPTEQSRRPNDIEDVDMLCGAAQISLEAAL